MASNFNDFWRNAGWSFDTVRLVGVAMVGSLFTSDAWNNVTFTAGEVRNPRRNLPLSLAFGVGIVSVLYILSNFVYLNVLTFDAIQHAAKDRVATAAAERMLGPVAAAGHGRRHHDLHLRLRQRPHPGRRPRLLRDGQGQAVLPPRRRARSQDHTPPSSRSSCSASGPCVLTLSGSYNDLLDYVIFAVLLFYILTIAGLFVLRRTRPDMDRPYKAIGYPVLPAVYIAAAGLIEVLLLAYKPNYTWPGLIIVLLGLPVYFIWRRKATI